MACSVVDPASTAASPPRAPARQRRDIIERGVIEYDAVTKVYPGGTKPAVSNLTMTIEAGTICALVGPSGCGKTTAMRMVNRLTDITSGQIRIDGRPNTATSEVELRRSIGYVIQQVGLFPHWTIEDNIATVPRMLGWDESRIRTRCAELLDVVGLPPAEYAQRYPAQLSGGQRQRVGVARALAADPPVMLMDEPFGAIDPVVRRSIQDEFLRLQEQVRKTIIIVTHDLEEAIHMGDTICVLREGGILGQHGTPHELLTAPADDFIRDFIGADAGLKQLTLATVAAGAVIDLASAAQQGFQLHVDAAGHPTSWADGTPATPAIPMGMLLRDALGQLLAAQAQYAPVVDDAGRAAGIVSVASIQHAMHLPAEEGAAAARALDMALSGAAPDASAVAPVQTHQQAFGA